MIVQQINIVTYCSICELSASILRGSTMRGTKERTVVLINEKGTAVIVTPAEKVNDISNY